MEEGDRGDGIEWMNILQSIHACKTIDFLNETLAGLEQDNPTMTKEEAVIRLLIDLKQAG